MDTRKRYFKMQELRANDADGKRTVGGYAAVFDVLSDNLGFAFEVYEKIQRGAFLRSLAEDQQMAFWNHNTDLPIGSTKNGSLRLKEDDHGLSFELDLPDTTMGRDVYTNIRDGIIDSMSFGFQALKEEIDMGKRDNDPVIRTLIEAKLFEVSPVVFPAYPQSEVEARGKLTDEELRQSFIYERLMKRKKGTVRSINLLAKRLRQIEVEMRMHATTKI
jgi:HK97 family phage prohead protease